MSYYYQAKEENDMNVSIYENSIVFNSKTYREIPHNVKISLEHRENILILNFSDNGYKIGNKRIGCKKAIRNLNIPLGKFKVVAYDKTKILVDTNKTVEKYQNSGQGFKGGRINKWSNKDDEWYERNTPDMYGVPNH